MGPGAWFRRLFRGSPSPEDEAAEREEYGSPDRGEADLERVDRGFVGFPSGEASEVAEADLEEFKPPRDPSP